MERIRYFNGQLLTAEDLQAEQDYFLDRHRRQNLRMHGAGIVSGLHVSIKSGEIQVGPGSAIDPQGNEIVVEGPQVLPLPKGCTSALLMIEQTERLARPVPHLEGPQFSRIEESFILRCVPEGQQSTISLLLAELRFFGGVWGLRPSTSSFSAGLWGAAILLAALCLIRKPRT